MNKYKKYLILGFIFIVAFCFRFWKLSKFPVSLSIDEVVIGYDAYSLLKTGRDHWGEFLPLAFKSIGDYKPPVLVYLMVPAIKLFGLNEFGIRFTIALIGSLTPLIAYGVVNKIMKNKNIALITSLLLAISPWHIHFSRSTFEAILALFFVMMGMFFFLRSLEKGGKQWWLAGIFLSLSMYSYHAERVFVPLILVALTVIFRKEIWKNRRKALMAIGISFVFLIPLITLMLSPKGQIRAKTGIFLNDYELATVRLAKMREWPDRSLVEKILNGEAVHSFSFWARRYLEYSDFSYLFFKGMNYTHPKFPDVGVINYFELPFFFLGIVALVCGLVKVEKKKRTLVIVWLLLGPLPASLANNAQHPLRSLTTLPIPQLISAIGIWYGFKLLKKIRISRLLKKVVLIGFVASGLISMVYYLNLYYVHFPVQYSHYLMYGFKESALYSWNNREKYDQIIFDASFGIEDKNITSIPFAYVLTYGKVEPKIIQDARKRNETPLAFEKFVFREVNWLEDRNLKNSLLIASFWQLPPNEIPNDQIVKVVSLYNGMPMFYLVETDKE